MVRQIQALLTADATLIAETGNSCAQTRESRSPTQETKDLAIKT